MYYLIKCVIFKLFINIHSKIDIIKFIIKMIIDIVRITVVNFV